MKRNLVSTLAVLTLGLGGCTETVESTDVRTSGVYPEFTVTATGNGTTQVEARLKVGGNNSNTFLDVEGGDTLEVTVDGETKTLEGRSGQVYTATFDVDAGGTEFVFSFLRDEDDDAPSSSVILPEPFALDVTSTDVVRLSDSVDFTWEPPGSGDIKVNVDGGCLFFEVAATPDDGAHSVAPEDLEGPGEDSGEECTGTVKLTRGLGGSIDSAFTEGGEITAYQVRTGTFRSLPPAM